MFLPLYKTSRTPLLYRVPLRSSQTSSTSARNCISTVTGLRRVQRNTIQKRCSRGFVQRQEHLPGSSDDGPRSPAVLLKCTQNYKETESAGRGRARLSPLGTIRHYPVRR